MTSWTAPMMRRRFASTRESAACADHRSQSAQRREDPAGSGSSGALQATERIGTGQQPAQGALWRTFCARTRCKQSDGALDVWTDRSDRNATVSTDPLTNDGKLKRQTRTKPGAAVVPCPSEKQIDAKPLRKSTQTRLGGRLNKSSYRKVESRIRYCPNGLNFARGSIYKTIIAIEWSQKDFFEF